jgi:hypothetical protein
MFKKMFGSKSEPAPGDETQRIAGAVEKIQNVIELLEKKSEHLQKKMDKELLAAKVCDRLRSPLTFFRQIIKRISPWLCNT